MSDWGRLYKKFYKNHKVEKASLAAIGLWALGNAWTRDHRASGYIPREDAATLSRGDTGLITELVDCGLWDVEREGYFYHDYRTHNPADQANDLAEALVLKAIPDDHPSLVRQRLVAKSRELLAEDTPPNVVERALKMWLAKPGAGPALLPFIAADVLRQKGTAQTEELLREAWRTGNISELEKLGYQFSPPDPPSNAGVKETRALMKAARENWLKQIAEELTK